MNHEIDPSDLQRFDGKVLTQTVFRHQGLRRDVLPPLQPPNTAKTAHSSEEIVPECSDPTATGIGRTNLDKDCRYSAAVSVAVFPPALNGTTAFLPPVVEASG